MGLQSSTKEQADIPLPSSKKLTDEKIELLKTQCGNHSNRLMSYTLNVKTDRIRYWLSKNPIAFSEHDKACYFCDNIHIITIPNFDNW